jgi:hypothetical protein
MVTDAERLDLWDNELEQLTTRAVAIYGGERVSDVVNHALRQLVAGRNVPPCVAAIKTVLKAALRRLVKPH